MQINPINNNYYNTYYTPSFGVNLHSKKLKFKKEDFFVRIKGYGNDMNWAQRVKETADYAVRFIRENGDFEEVLKIITKGVTEANKNSLDINKKFHTGILRTSRDGWRHGSKWDKYELITVYGKNSHNKYVSYADRLDYIRLYPLHNPYRDISLTRPVRDKDFGKYLEHGDSKYVTNALTHVKNIYKGLYSKYIKGEANNDNLREINSSIAEIRWLMAHATPWERGSDAISNIFIRSLYKAMGIKAAPLKKGVSLDMEAYCTELEDYKKNFTSYFVKAPFIPE